METTNTSPNKRMRLGDLLIAKKLISQAQLEEVLTEQNATGKKIGRIVLDKKFVSEHTLLHTLSESYRIPFIDLKKCRIDPETIAKLEEKYARRYKCLLISEDPGGIHVGMQDPLDLVAIDELQRILGKPLHPAFVKESDLNFFHDRIYSGNGDDIADIAIELEGSLAASEFNLSDLDDDNATGDAPVVRLLQSILEDAVRVKASDIHIEPDELVLRVRYRVDGALNERIMKEKRIANALVLRLKIMSSLDISERRIPQDGRFNIRLMNKSVDVRISTMPLQYGESVVMRLLDQSEGVKEVEELGMPKFIAERFKTLISRPHGMLLVTGPTGSGKSTTLYSALKTLNTPDKKVITVEDPIEYRMDRVNQVQINNKIGLNFATVLRTVLRQDPDVIMVGEMRDQETAEIGLRAALTGHFVLSTLHTNDAISCATRLVDMGIDSFLVASALRAVVAQRLVRRVCQECSTVYTPTAQERSWLESMTNADIDSMTFKAGSGCPNCNESGYSGRIGVFELLEMNDEMIHALSKGDTNGFTAAAKRSKNYHSSSQCALAYARRGYTTIQEVFKISASL